MKYITRSGSSPQGIPKVYFTGHPEDCRQYLEGISEDILKFQNCAVFYDKNPEQPENPETFFLDLSRMQLIVIVITNRFVHQDTFAFREVFRYAVGHHIPVLPVLEEAGIESAFNKKCGDLQFLNPHSTDMTEISYEEKLKKFLDSVLVGDELAEKIRDAFDAYVFLSYRKKDRKYAQELMRLIHQNDFCRDIAIWYDEFLVPGENFNDAIQKAMEKSQLFALTVTPSLLENPNYVMTIEYPAAKDSGKAIIPVTLAPTDRKELLLHYQGIPEPFDPTDTPGISQALMDAIGALDHPENNNDPQHVFFIGLAYLSGIDVEINHERAVEMITFSAETGLPEAIEKLVVMYRNGEGVARNYETAILWQERLVNTFQEAYKANPCEDSMMDWLNALNLLSDFYKEAGHLAKTVETCKEILRVSEEQYKADGSLRAIACFAYTCRQLGQAMIESRQYDAAIKYLETGISYGEQLLEYEDIPEVKRNLLNYSILGDVYIQLEEYESAYDCYSRGYQVVQELYETQNTEFDRINFIIIHTKLGNCFVDMKKPESAMPYYQKACKLCEPLAGPGAAPKHKHNLAGIYGEMGNTCKILNQLEQAEAYFLKSLALKLEYANETGTPDGQRNIALCYDQLGHLYFQMGKLEDAKQFFTEALHIYTQLAGQTDYVSVQEDQYYSYGFLGDICKAQGTLDEAKACYQMTIWILKLLAGWDENWKIQQNLAFGYGKIGNICEEQNNRSEAKQYYLEAARTAEKAMQEKPSPRTLDILAMSCMNYAILSRRLSEQIEYLRQAGDCCRRLLEIFPDNAYYRENLMKINRFLEDH